MKKLFWVVVVILVVIGIIWAINKNGPSLYPSYSVSPSPSSTAKTGYKATPIPKPGSTLSLQTYTQLFNQYTGKIIQFNDKCQGVPGQMVLKKGTKILLDNRSSIPKTILMDKQTFNLGAYGYQVVTVTTDRVLPYYLGIDCRSAGGSGENTTSLLIQAAILQFIK